MKLIFSLLFAFAAINSYSQKPPNREAIENEISNPVSKYYYPRLMERYEKNDTTLNFDEYFHLYYGYPFQENYKPLLTTNYVDSLSNLFANRRISNGDVFSKIERYSKAILTVEPFNLRDINILIFSYQNMGYRDKAELQSYKLDMLKNVILSTGTGLTDTAPWHVIYSDHAEDLLNLMDVEPGRKIIMTRNVEFISNKKPERDQPKGYYFDYSEIYKKKPDYLENIDKPKRKLEINTVPKDKDIK